jgi:hypothetical protein
MEKISDKIAALPEDANFFSLEFFPPKTQIVGLPDFLLLPLSSPLSQADHLFLYLGVF